MTTKPPDTSTTALAREIFTRWAKELAEAAPALDAAAETIRRTRDQIDHIQREVAVTALRLADLADPKVAP